MTLSTPQARRAIEDEIQFYSAHILHLRTVLNSLAPISTLPPETLCAIFSHATETDGSNAYKNAAAYRSMVNISHVCTHWRDVALGCPTLWSTLYLEAIAPQDISEIFRRSQEAPLAISWIADDNPSSLNRITTTSDQDLARALRSQLWRVRTLSLRLRHGKENRILRELDAPAPLLESLTIHCTMVTSSKAHVNISQLLHHPENLRQLELICVPIGWSQVTLPHLTHLTISGRPHMHTNYYVHVEFLLSAIARMPMLEDLRIIAALADSSTVLLTESSQITLPYLRSLRVEENAFHCSRFLRDLVIPSLCQLSLDMSGTEHALPADLFAIAIMEKAASLGSFGTVTVVLGVSACVGAYSDVYDIAAIDKLHRADIKTRPPALSVRFGGRPGSRWLEWNAAVLCELCRLLPLDNVRTLLLAGHRMSDELWKVLAQRASNVECLSVYNGTDVTPAPFPEVLTPPSVRREDTDTGSNEKPCPLPQLQHLALVDCYFSVQHRRGWSDSQAAAEEETFVDRLIGCFTSRAEHGTGIEHLHIIRPVDLRDEELVRLKKTVDNLDWDEGGEGAIPGSGFNDRWDFYDMAMPPQADHWAPGVSIWGTENIDQPWADTGVVGHWDPEDMDEVEDWGMDEVEDWGSFN